MKRLLLALVVVGSMAAVPAIADAAPRGHHGGRHHHGHHHGHRHHHHHGHHHHGHHHHHHHGHYRPIYRPVPVYRVTPYPVYRPYNSFYYGSPGFSIGIGF